jgi:predicted DNA-binding transcriptional regulator AlpA
MAKRKPRRTGKGTGTGVNQQAAKPPRTPAKQPPYEALLGKHGTPATTAMTALPHRRQGDRGGGSHDDDDSDMRVLLPVYVRFSDLRAAGVVRSWVQLARLIDYESFPAGVLLGPNSRAWQLDVVQAWLSARPPGRKIALADAGKRDRRQGNEAEAR